jgi:hypothetical protein
MVSNKKQRRLFAAQEKVYYSCPINPADTGCFTLGRDDGEEPGLVRYEMCLDLMKAAKSLTR